MTVRRLIYDADAPDGGPDIVMAARLMSAVPNPAYYPDAASLGSYLTDPTVSVFVDDVAEQLAVLTFLEKRRQVRCTWGLPILAKITVVAGKPVVSLGTTVAATASLTALRSVAKAAERDMLARHPEAAEWRYVGEFQIAQKDGTTITSDGGRALCLAWQSYDYLTSTVGPDGKGNYSMWAPFKDVVL